MNASPAVNRRILLVDDNPAIHEDFRKILVEREAQVSEIDAAAAQFFGDRPATTAGFMFEVASATQGEQALAMVLSARDAHRPFAMAFIDMRMPPGWNGLETTRRLWEIDPTLETVICTAYSDHSWAEIQKSLGASDRLLILKKPFDTVEVQQMALALTEKWNLRQRIAADQASVEAGHRRHTAHLLGIHQSQLQCIATTARSMLNPVHSLLASAITLEAARQPAHSTTLAHQVLQDGERINALARDLLHLAALQVGVPKASPEAVPLDALCTRALQTGDIDAALKGLVIRVETRPGIQHLASGDPIALQQLIRILIDLAVKRVPEGRILIRFPRRPATHEIDVRIELPESGQPQGVDDPAEAREFASVLDLARQLAALQGGRIETWGGEGLGIRGLILTLPQTAP